MLGLAAGRLRQLGIQLPEPAPARGNYDAYVVSGNLVYVSGQLSQLAGTRYVGKLGAELSLEDGYKAARACAINVLAQLNAACGGDLSRVARCVELGGFVNSAPHFHDQPKVLDGASDLLAEVLGPAGRHTRYAVGAAALPSNFAVEVKAVFELLPYEATSGP
jgi:enamine deaminase RidA (YjgF/YER057c/UK114 family)